MIFIILCFWRWYVFMYLQNPWNIKNYSKTGKATTMKHNRHGCHRNVPIFVENFTLVYAVVQRFVNWYIKIACILNYNGWYSQRVNICVCVFRRKIYKREEKYINTFIASHYNQWQRSNSFLSKVEFRREGVWNVENQLRVIKDMEMHCKIL